MDNRNAILIIVAILGAFAGAAVVNMTKKSGDSGAFVGQQLGMVISSQGAITERLAKLETQQSNILRIVEQARQVPQGMPQQGAQAAGGCGQPQQRQQGCGGGAGQPAEDANKVYDIPVGQSYVMGKKDAPVTVVAFYDFQCPFCSRFNAPLMEAAAAYPDKVKVIFKNYPLSFHPLAKPAAKAALAAGEQGKYYEMANAILKDNSNLTDDLYKQLAQSIGLNVDKFLKDLKDKDAQYEQSLQQEMTLGTQVAVQGTPTFFINGKKTQARDTVAWKTEIDQVLKGSGGSAQNQVYVCPMHPDVRQATPGKCPKCGMNLQLAK